MRNISWCPCLNTRLNLNIGINYVERAVVTCNVMTLCPGVQLRLSPERGPQPVLPLQHGGRLQEGQTLRISLHLPSKLRLITQPFPTERLRR